jgi:hypothetical protein
VVSKISQSSDTPEAIARAMGLADLQVELLEVDMASATRNSIASLFEGHEGDETAGRMQKNAQSILEFQDGLSDRELIQALFKIQPRGKVDVETTAYSIACDFHHPLDWAQVHWKGRSDINRLLRIPHMLIPKGYSCSTGAFRPDDPDGKVHLINTDVHRAFGIRKLAPVKRHELRHSMNAEVSPRRPLDGCLTDYEDVPDGELVDVMVGDLAKRTMHPLKNEISAFIFGGNQSQSSLKHLVFLFSPLIGSYDFNGGVKRSLNYWGKKGIKKSVIGEVRREWKDAFNINEILDRSYSAVELLEQKGYSHDWAVSFLSVEDNLTADWLSLAEACPVKGDA